LVTPSVVDLDGELLWKAGCPPPPALILPDDETRDELLTPEVVLRRATERYPVDSMVVDVAEPNTVREAFTQRAQQNFRSALDQIDPRITARLDQPFGKDNLLQFFYSEPGLRHVLLPLWKSGYLAGDKASWESFCLAYYPARLLRDLLRDYGDTPFHGIRGFPEGWETETTVNEDRVAMATAALLHFNGSVADLVRWIGGPHVNAHRDHSSILATLVEAGAPEPVLSDLRRIFYDGIPAKCQAFSNEENFSAYYRYGNHSTVDIDPDKALQALIKDNRKGFTLLFDSRAVLLMLHCHLTPQGMVDLDTPYKNPRPIFDSSFRPHPWCLAINDWTDKANEPPLTFAGAEMGLMTWVYNLRVTYPKSEIYLADDDVSGAFRLVRYHPNLTAMHTFKQGPHAVVNTGGSFGDNTTPSSFDRVALARRIIAWWRWVKSRDHSRVLKYLPPLQLAPEPTSDEVAQFCPADADGINTGVLDDDGNRRAPPYNMHVDDCMFADVAENIIHSICVSVTALFLLLGYPDNPLVPSPLSMDKFVSQYNHQRKLVGRHFDTRRLTVGLLAYKRLRLLELLCTWSTMSSFNIIELATLLGVLENHTKYARWARCWYTALQNHVRRVLRARYAVLDRLYKGREQERRIKNQLPPGLAHRLESLLARDKAHLLWSTYQRFGITSPIAEAVEHLHHYVASNESPWEVPLGLIVPREPHFWSRGDASLVGGGGYCPALRFWFDLTWTAPVLRGVTLKSSDLDYVHINSLEFIVIIVQLAAIKTRIEGLTPSDAAIYFPMGRPHIPVWYGETDNTVSNSWANKVTASSTRGQALVAVFAELLRTTLVHTSCEHLAGVDNVVADDISRNDFSLSSAARCRQLFLKQPSLALLDYFQPSPELLQVLTLRLFSTRSPGLCVLPPVLGQFVPAGCTTFGSASI
jgi:hypothetical protein